MNTRTSINFLSRRFAAAAAAALLVGIGGAASALETEGVTPEAPAALGAYLRTTTASTNLSNDGSSVTALTVNVAAGTWIVTAKATAINFGAADYVRCRILVAGVQEDASATLVGNAAPGHTGEEGPSAATIAMQTAIKTTGVKAFSLACSHDGAIPGEYLDPGASLIIVKAPGSIH